MDRDRDMIKILISQLNLNAQCVRLVMTVHLSCAALCLRLRSHFSKIIVLTNTSARARDLASHAKKCFFFLISTIFLWFLPDFSSCEL